MLYMCDVYFMLHRPGELGCGGQSYMAYSSLGSLVTIRTMNVHLNGSAVVGEDQSELKIGCYIFSY